MTGRQSEAFAVYVHRDINNHYAKMKVPDAIITNAKMGQNVNPCRICYIS
jgi:hypothetical protein